MTICICAGVNVFVPEFCSVLKEWEFIGQGEYVYTEPIGGLVSGNDRVQVIEIDKGNPCEQLVCGLLENAETARDSR